MEYIKALKIAERVLAELRPHCIRAEIAGSVRRKKPEVKDIEIVLIPKPYQTGLFSDGIAEVINQWEKVKGELPCKYTQRILPEGIKLDLFIVEPGNWGLQFAIRTGSAEYSHRVLAANWVARGYHARGGYLYTNGKRYDVPEEKDLFERISVGYIDPEFRNI
jgi:DNA polymerase/3'-5' exonuclease PolX